MDEDNEWIVFDSDAELEDLLASTAAVNGLKTVKLTVKLLSSFEYPKLPLTTTSSSSFQIPLNDGGISSTTSANDSDLEVMLRTLATSATVPASSSATVPASSSNEDEDALSMVEVTPDMLVVDDACSLTSSSASDGLKQRNIKGKAPAVAPTVQEKAAEGSSSTPPRPQTSLSSYSAAQFAGFVDFFQNLFYRHPELVANVRRVLAQIILTVGATTSHIYTQLQSALEEGYSRAMRQYQLQRSQFPTSFTRADAHRFTAAAISAAETSVRTAAPFIHQGVALATPLVQRGVALATPLVQQGFTFAVDGIQSLTRRVGGDLNLARERYSHIAFQRRSPHIYRPATSAPSSAPNALNQDERIKLEDLAYAGAGKGQGGGIGSYPLYYPGSTIPAVVSTPSSSTTPVVDNNNTGTTNTGETLPRYTPPSHPAPFHTQMQMLTSMGFIDMDLNLALLEQCKGDVHRVIEFLSS